MYHYRTRDGEEVDAVIEHHDGRIVGYRLTKPDGTVYDVSTTEPYGWTCDCPDMTFRSERPGGCKHVRSLQAALAQLA